MLHRRDLGAVGWEQPPRGARWLIPVVLLAAATVAVALAVASRPQPSRPLSVLPTSDPGGEITGDTVDTRSFTPERLSAVASSTEQLGDRATLAGAGDLTIVAADDTGLEEFEAATGVLRRVELHRPQRAPFADTLFTVGDDIVTDAGRDVVALSRGSRRPLRIAAGHRAIRTIADDAVWVVDSFAPYASGTASLVTFGGVVQAQSELPPGAVPLVGSSEGLLIATPGAISLASGDGRRRLIARGLALATNGTRLAWLRCEGDMSCTIHIGTIDDPHQVTSGLDPAVLPAGFFGLPTGTLSPDGRWLVLPRYERRDRRGLGDVVLSVIDTGTGAEVFRARGSSSDPFDTPVAWSPDSRWLIVAADTEIRAWDSASNQTATLDVDVTGVRALTTR